MTSSNEAPAAFQQRITNTWTEQLRTSLFCSKFLPCRGLYKRYYFIDLDNYIIIFRGVVYGAHDVTLARAALAQSFVVVRSRVSFRLKIATDKRSSHE